MVAAESITLKAKPEMRGPISRTSAHFTSLNAPSPRTSGTRPRRRPGSSRTEDARVALRI